MDFNQKPNLRVVEAIRQAQRDGKLNKPKLLTISEGKITAYNPMCMFKPDIQKNLLKISEQRMNLEIFPVEIHRVPADELAITDFICVSLLHPAGDINGLLNCMAKAVEEITGGVYGNIVSLENVYTFTDYEAIENQGVFQDDIVVIPIQKGFVTDNLPIAEQKGE